MIDHGIIGVQGDLKYTEKRFKMAEQLRKLTQLIVFQDLFKSSDFTSALIEDSQKVSFRRFVISAPRDNMTEPFRFSSRHSEFIKLKAEALLSQIQQQTQDDDELKMYKVVIQYPDHSAAQACFKSNLITLSPSLSTK